MDLHSCQDQKYGEVDLDDHVDVVSGKASCSKADGHEEHGWDEHSQQVVDNRSAQGQLDNDAWHVVKHCFTHTDPSQGVPTERNVGVVLQKGGLQFCGTF